MKTAVFVAFLGFCSGTSAQELPMTVNIKGEPLLSVSSGYVIQGSYFFLPNYTDAVLIFSNAKRYHRMPVKLDLMKNQLVYQVDNGQEMIMTTSIKEIRFMGTSNSVFKSGFPPVNRLNENTYYEQLDSGRAFLLKHYAVSSWDDRPYGGAPTRNYQQRPEYFAFVGGKMVALDKGNPSAVMAAFSDKKAVADYIKTNNLKFKKEEDYIAVSKYYNSL